MLGFVWINDNDVWFDVSLISFSEIIFTGFVNDIWFGLDVHVVDQASELTSC